jgi:hypothetical protein
MAKFRPLVGKTELDVFDFLCLRQKWPSQHKNEMNATYGCHFGTLRNQPPYYSLVWLARNLQKTGSAVKYPGYRTNGGVGLFHLDR